MKKKKKEKNATNFSNSNGTRDGVIYQFNDPCTSAPQNPNSLLSYII